MTPEIDPKEMQSFVKPPMATHLSPLGQGTRPHCASVVRKQDTGP